MNNKIKNIKKYFFIFLLFFIFFLPLPSKANENEQCNWKIYKTTTIDPGTGVSIGSGGCEGLEKESPYDKCDEEPKPKVGLKSQLYCCCRPIKAPQLPKESKLLDPLDNLQIKLPGLVELIKDNPPSTVEDTDGNKTYFLPWISIYITALYNYLLSIGGILAVITIMIGGLIWLVSAGNASRISEAKSWIVGSLTGIIILLTSYLLLDTINPNLINFKHIKIENIEEIAGDTAAPSVNGSAGQPFSSGAKSDHLTSIGIICPRTGGSSKIKEIAESFNGKVVYRLGSKNGQGDEYNKEKAQETYGLSCPNNSKWGEKVVCYDCSGFVRQVLWCAGFSTDPGAGTSIIFKNAEEVKAWGDTTYNGGKELKPGDLVGWPPKDNVTNSGHVYIYIGDGKLANVYGNRRYSPPKAYAVVNFREELTYRIKTKKLTLYVKKMSN